MNHLYKKGIYLFLCVFWSAITFAQVNPTIKSTLNGTVQDLTTNQPLPGAVVRIKGTTHSVSTDSEGKFSFRTGQSFPYVLIISFIGYEQKELTVNGSPVTIRLQETLNQLNDVVVTGYSTQERKYIAGSISSISGSTVQNQPSGGFNQLLQGKTTGVQVTSNSGVPGGGITFRVRGNNSINASVDPLYIIDGVFVNNSDPITAGLGNQAASNPLSDLNPSDIEDIQILKDANATAIYGSLGANGVIIVTTKRGTRNTKANINLNTFQGWSTAVDKFKVASGPEVALLTNESRINTAKDNGLDPSTVVLPFPDPSSQPTYDRISGLFRTARTENYELSTQGGTDKSTYYISLGYLNQESIVKPSDYTRYSGRLNYDNYLTDKLKIGTSINFTRSDRNLSGSDNNPTGVINSALFPRSYLPIYNADGTYARYGSFDNHLALIENLDSKATGWRTIGNIFGEYNILPGLKLRSSWSLDNTSEYDNSYSNTLISAGIASNGSASSSEVKTQVLTNEQVLSFVKSLGANKKHNINALIGNTINTVLNQSTTATGTGFAANSLKSVSVAATRSGSASRAETKLLSFFSKASYTYDGKYTIDGSIRADGSSKFGTNKRWGYFPSGGVAWRLSQEDFIKDLNFFNELKLRASLGLSGNQNGIGAYAAQGLWSSGANYLEQPGIAPTQLINPDLTWETTRQFNVGTDFSILKNRLSITADYYNKYTYDLLLNVPVPYRSGFASYLQNYGAVRNKGFELGINSTNIETDAFQWTTNFNISFNKNKIEKLASDISLGASGRNISILRQGYSVNSFQLYKQLYVDPQTGNAVYDDVNKDGIITSADRQIVGNALPKYTGGLTNNFTYKGFDFSFFFYFQQGNKIMNMNDFFMVHGGTQANIGFLPRQLERWQNPGDVTDIPRLTTYSANPTQNGGAANNYGGNVASLSSRYLEDGSFIRLKALTLSYSLPKDVLGRIGVSKLRIYVQGTNLLTFTKYGGLDPEVSSQSNNQNTVGYDWATVPQPKTIQVGANVTF
ncbi:TonB-linked outer membrane protein, SusC/RagA family [Pedobacter westerhofensis]|uniref:TonB-linked outer membrane protein, SusC/RagA family n=1 Tax=Pedobacter westerhofensis TaxID=425512 RepID=A0A521FRJ7_9SPHI|nr:TonB-dependent receptor [Pedobacter westerhofensis]SMO98684.1 TonB-linked outer membrane protein, SusC/RagA family [Pedobacter westerhofensis]